MNSNIILNPVTNRFIKVNGFLYNRLLKEGLITPQDKPTEPVEPVESPTQIKPVESPPDKGKLTTLVKETAHALVTNNENMFKNLTQKETTALLHRLLLEKLCAPDRTRSNLRAPRLPVEVIRSKPKKKPKTKFKLTPVPESDSDYSESDSES